MKLAAIYNVFDAEELLQKSINSIRENIDIVIVIYQEVSNFNKKHRLNITNFVKNLNGIDYIEKYETNLTIPAFKNELTKRILGCKKAVELGCTHFLHIDCDELYDTEQFKKAKESIILNNYDSTACKFNDYYKYDDLQVINDDSYIPFIHKLEKGITKFGFNLQYPVLVDATRKANPINNFYLFKENELAMKHYSWIRSDVEQIQEKLMNSTARPSYNSFLNEILKEYQSFNPQDQLVRLETGLLVPLSLVKKNNIPWSYKLVKTIIKK